ncbi:hypothetical protein C8Q74DRAFT_1373732 [Fomes fomentarius]|nr:hypothetical protein C8Q74DRAFT_1373732 [Fomes fomentarius]
MKTNDIAFQQARDYWAANPDSKEHGPSEVHRSIEQWLVTKNILEGPAATTDESAPEPSVDMSPSTPEKRRSFKIPSWPPINLRRLSLPAISNTDTILKSRRRRTESTTSLPSPSSCSGAGPEAPRSPKTAWRSFAGAFRTPSKKRSSSRSTDFGCIREETPSIVDIECTSLTIAEETAEAITTAATSSEGDKFRMILIDPYDKSDASDVLTAPLFCDSPEQMSRSISPSPSEVPEEVPEEPQPIPSPAIDPAYRALMPILHQLESITENPRRNSVSEEFQDEGYVGFWETFAQLTPKEILYAVYAIRAGALDVQFEHTQGQEFSGVTLLLSLWAFAATVAVAYLYWRLP